MPWNEPLRNEEAFQFFDQIVGQGAAIFETAGALARRWRAGWALAKLPVGLSFLLKKRFYIDRDLHIITDDDTAVFQRGVPAHAEIVTIDYGSCNKAGARHGSLVHVADPERRLPLPQIVHL